MTGVQTCALPISEIDSEFSSPLEFLSIAGASYCQKKDSSFTRDSLHNIDECTLAAQPGRETWPTAFHCIKKWVEGWAWDISSWIAYWASLSKFLSWAWKCSFPLNSKFQEREWRCLSWFISDVFSWFSLCSRNKEWSEEDCTMVYIPWLIHHST